MTELRHSILTKRFFDLHGGYTNKEYGQCREGGRGGSRLRRGTGQFQNKMAGRPSGYS